MKKLLAIATDLARGLAAAHRQQVLHRDIKPANAILSEDGVTKLLDFGLAELDAERSGVHLVSERAASAARSEVGAPHAAGTPLYQAPELWRGEPATTRSDVYALGLVLYELCSGTHPFAGLSLSELRRAVVGHEIKPLAELAPGVDAHFARLVDRCVSGDAQQRYSDGGAVREACDMFAERGRARRVSFEGQPYRGLVAFDAEHRDLFFGRRSESRTVIERLRSERLLVVAGDSGTGKSSLCRAGVIPELREGALGPQVVVEVLTLGGTPVVALAAMLAKQISTSETVLAELLVHDCASIGRDIRRVGKELIIFIDQFEELCTLAEPDEAKVVSEALHALIHSQSVRVLLTARSDFLTRLTALPGLGDDLSAALYLLRPLSPERLREAVVSPAEAMDFAFESEQVITALLEETQRAEGGLPLLQFALSELWEARDQTRRVIPGAALIRIGGVVGALARHADGVLAALPPPERVAARDILRALVTAEGTRGRRGHAELIQIGSRTSLRAAAALDALVRGRLLVAQEAKDDGKSAYTIAHEALLEGWDTLKSWLDQDAESRVARQRLEHAAAEWERLGKPADALWSARLLSEVGGIEQSTLTPREAEFLRVASSAAFWRRAQKAGLLLGFPAALAATVIGVRVLAARDASRHQDLAVAESRSKLGIARTFQHQLQEVRQAALFKFDHYATDAGNALWKQALGIEPLVDRYYADAEEGLERVLQDDPRRSDARGLLADALLERATLAESVGRTWEKEDLVRRLGIYGFADRWTAPASISVTTRPSGATVTLQQYFLSDGRWRESSPVELGDAPTAPRQVPPGSMVLNITMSSRVPVRLPLVLSRGEAARLTVDLPLSEAIPEGLTYVPAGRFLYGADGEDARAFYVSQPAHAIETDAYLIARNKTTFGEWIEFLDAQLPDERRIRTPNARRQSFMVALMRSPDGQYTLALGPDLHPYVAKKGEQIRYMGRRVRVSQDWQRMPVTGVSYEDLVAYTTWLNGSHRVPNARPCTDHEWERAARGADGRAYPHGERLEPDEANFDLTYGRNPMAWGPDEVGSHPESDSPFGIHDMAGNGWEWVQSSEDEDPAVARAGSFIQSDAILRSANRAKDVVTRRDAFYGIRICATVAVP
jgi:formylglycine-generating enzyme required for sulfatase activity